MELENEVYFLKEEIIRLKEENEGLQQDRELAGELGKSLLENNQELERRLEEVNAEYISALGKLEELKQDNHTLRSKLDTEIRTNSNHAHELEDLKENLRKEFETKEESQQLTTEKKINDLRKEIESLQNDVSKHTLIENQLQEKIKKQEEMLRKAHQSNEELQHKGRSRLDSIEEYVNLASELKEERDILIMKVADYEDNQERILFDRNALKERVGYLEEELQEKTRQAQTWLNCLQEARLEAGELKAELENLKADNARRNFGKQGNSLFGEVEDRRLELEKKYSSLQARHEGMVKIHNMTKQHLRRLKNQVATLLQVKSCHADASQIQRLTRALVQKEGEVKILNAKISTLEKQKEGSNMSDRLMEFHDAFSEFGDKKDYVNFLQLQLEDSKKTVAELNKELQTKTLLQLAETDRLRQTEHQLHASESKVEKLNSENIKLRLKIDDLRIKLQSHSQKEPSTTYKPQNANSSVRKSKSAAGLINTKTTSLQQPPSKDQGPENFASVAKVTKTEPVTAKPKVNEISSTKPPVVLSSDGLGQVFEYSPNGKESSEIVAPFKEKSTDNNWTKLSASRILPLSSNSAENEVRIEEKREQKIKVRFQTDIVHPTNCQPNNTDLSETQTGKEQAEFCTEKELQKENYQPEESNAECGNISRVTVKGQKKAPVVINVKKGEAKNQCPQQ